MDARETQALMGDVAAVVRMLFAPIVDRLDAIERRFSEMPAPAPGKDADLAEVRRMIETAVASVPRAAAVDMDAVRGIAREEAASAVAALPPMPEIPELPELPDVPALVADAVERAVAAIPPAKDGHDPDPAAVEALVVAQVEKAIAALPKPKDGESVSSDDLRPMVDEAVQRAVAGIPAAKDGVGLAGALIDREGHLVLTLTNGETKNLGRVDGKDGDPGKPGADGFSLEDLSVEHDGERGLTLRFARGDLVKEFTFTIPGIIYRGVWKEGAYAKGDMTTWGGSAWVAMEDTADQPEKSAAWRLAVKRGDRGKDLRPDEPKGPPVVKLPGAGK